MAFAPFAVLTALFAATALIIGGPAHQASAAGCHWFDYHATLTSGSYVYTNQYTIPSNSSCNDINIFGQIDYSGTPVGANVRVRFYPSSDGNYANSWRWHCSLHDMVIASTVVNGTHYRLEFDTDFALEGAMYN